MLYGSVDDSADDKPVAHCTDYQNLVGGFQGFDSMQAAKLLHATEEYRNIMNTANNGLMCCTVKLYCLWKLSLTKKNQSSFTYIDAFGAFYCVVQLEYFFHFTELELKVKLAIKEKKMITHQDLREQFEQAVEVRC